MGRVAAIDRLRGLCIVSMLLGHFAHDTSISKVLHLPLWVDGAMGFVMISGIVLGIVRRRSLASGRSFGYVVNSAARRIGHLWLIFVLMVVGSVTAAERVGRGEMTPPVADMGGWSDLIVNSVTVQHSLRYVDLLSVYLYLLALSPLMIWLLMRRLGSTLVIAFSLGVYVLDVIVPLEPFRLEVVRLLDGDVELSTVVVAARWLILFNTGLVLGWHWPRVDAVIRRRWVTVMLIGATAVLTATARITDELGMRPPEWLIDKTLLSPGTLVFAVIAVVGLIRLLELVYERPTVTAGNAPTRDPGEEDRLSRSMLAGLSRHARNWSGSVLHLLGRYSLAAYLIHLLVVQLIDLTVGFPTAQGLGLGLTVVSMAAGLAWAYTRDRLKATPPVRSVLAGNELAIQP